MAIYIFSVLPWDQVDRRRVPNGKTGRTSDGHDTTAWDLSMSPLNLYLHMQPKS